MTISRYILCLIANLLTANLLWGQITDPDSLFSKAQSLANQRYYSGATELIDELRNAYPENWDYELFAVRILVWEGRLDQAEQGIDALFEKGYQGLEGTELRIQIANRLQHFEKELAYLSEAKRNYPEQIGDWWYQEIQLLEALNRNKEALIVLDSVRAAKLEIRSVNLDYLELTILQKQKNMLTASYLNTSFSPAGFAPQQYGSLEYRRKEKSTTYIGRVNYAHAFQNDALQGEADIYTAFKHRDYLYLNAGFSNGSSIFPLFRAGAEYYRHVSRPSELSLGGRYLHFSTVDVAMLTASYSFYVRTWKFQYRPYLAYDGNTFSHSHQVTVRKNFLQEKYAEINLQYGTTPYYLWISEAFTRTAAYRVGFRTQFRIKKNWFIRPSFMYEREEYVPGLERNRFNSWIELSKRF